MRKLKKNKQRSACFLIYIFFLKGREREDGEKGRKGKGEKLAGAQEKRENLDPGTLHMPQTRIKIDFFFKFIPKSHTHTPTKRHTRK